MHATNLATLTGAPTMPWQTVLTRLDAGFDQAPGAEAGEPGRHTTWVTTINADGSPHVTAVGATWLDQHFYFVTGPRTRRGRNLARDPRCALSLSVREFDLVLEGATVRVTGEELVRVAAHYHDDGGWPCEPDASAEALTAPFNAQSAGPAPWHAHRIDARSAHAVQCVEPYGATRWSF